MHILMSVDSYLKWLNTLDIKSFAIKAVLYTKICHLVYHVLCMLMLMSYATLSNECRNIEVGLKNTFILWRSPRLRTLFCDIPQNYYEFSKANGNHLSAHISKQYFAKQKTRFSCHMAHLNPRPAGSKWMVTKPPASKSDTQTNKGKLPFLYV